LSAPERLRVELGPRSYEILIGSGVLGQAGSHLRGLLRRPDAIVITDDHLAASAHLDVLEASLDAAGIAHRRIVVPPGEQSKSMGELERLLDRMLASGMERSSTVLALGGGVVGDLAGFAAAIVLRGVDYVQVPTTLLAQVDSAIGGKTGIDTPRGKNLIGAFHQPRIVLSDVDTLDTLPPRELRAGYAEVVKYGLIDRPDFFDWLETNGPALLGGDAALRRHAVLESCRAKAAIVAADERETGARALLNLGHTFAHALEAVAQYGDELLHGEAVAIGMALAFELSARLGLCPRGEAERVRRHLDTVGLPTAPRQIRAEGFAADALLEAMTRDKKALRGRPRFVLARGIGQAFAGAKVEADQIRALLDDGT
jgi:3-dehydroquinate synthase